MDHTEVKGTYLRQTLKPSGEISEKRDWRVLSTTYLSEQSYYK